MSTIQKQIIFKDIILQGIPTELPELKPYDSNINHAPKRKAILNSAEKKLALKNALRYFDKKHHPILAKEFLPPLLSDLNFKYCERAGKS